VFQQRLRRKTGWRIRFPGNLFASDRRHGGTPAWRVLDATGKLTAERGKSGLLLWSNAAAFAERSKDFVILH